MRDTTATQPFITWVYFFSPLESQQIQQYQHIYFFVDVKNKQGKCLNQHFYPQHLAQCLSNSKHSVDIC